MLPLKQSTAVTIKFGPFLDETDGKTAETALTISQADVRLSKNGGNMAQKNESSSAAHDEIGFYEISLDATDTNTAGRLLVAVHESGALPVWLEYLVVPANVYDSLVGGSDYLQADVVQVEGADAADQIREAVVDDATRIDASALNTLSGHDPGGALAAQSDITGLNDPTAASIAGAVWDEAKSGHAAAGSFGEEVQDHALFSEIATASEIAGQVWDEALSGHSTAGSAGKKLSDAAQSDELPNSPPTAAQVADQVWQEALGDHSGLSGSTAEALDNAGGGLSAAAIADQVWQEQLGDHSGTSGSAAEYLDGAGGGSTPSAIADAVWDEALSGHTSSGTAGKALQDIPGAKAGAIEYTYTINDGSSPLEGAEVWISTDSGGANIIWYGTTDASGIARASNNEKPWLDAGTYYAFVKKAGYSFSNPDTMSVS